MLNNLFKLVSRAEHNALKGERTALLDLLATVKLERDAAQKQAYVSECDRHAARKEREEVQEEYAKAIDRELKATELLHRALTRLQQVVNAPRSGGKQWREDREALFADAMLAGLWGELPGKEG